MVRRKLVFAGAAVLSWGVACDELSGPGGSGSGVDSPGDGERPQGPSPATLKAGGRERTGQAEGPAGAKATNPPFAKEAADELLRIDRPGRQLGRYGGTLRMVSASPPRTFNPLLINDVHTAAMFERTVYSALVDYDREAFKIEPSLAQLWERSEDGRTWTFELRPGLRWSDGTALTAQDVVFSFWAAMDPKVGSGAAAGLRDAGGGLPEVEAQGGKVVFRLKGDHALFLPAIASVFILPAARWEKAWKAGSLAKSLGTDTPPDQVVASGPFRLGAYEPGKRLTLERNPHSFLANVRGMRLPYLDRMEWRIASDYEEALRWFQAGKVDVYDQIRPIDMDRLEAAQAASGYSVMDLGPSHRVTFLAFNLRKGGGLSWAADKDFRRAVAHAVDRKAIVDRALRGRGRPQTSMVSAADRAWAPSEQASAAIPEFDPAKARTLLGKMGLRDRNRDGVLEDAEGRKVAFEIATNAEDAVRVQAAARVAEDLRRVGVGAEVQPVPFARLVSKITRSEERWSAVVLGFGGNVPPDPAMWENVYRSSGALHVWNARQKSPATEWERRIDALTATLSGDSDFLVRKQAHDKILAVLAEQQPLVHLYSPNLFVGARSNVRNFRPSSLRPHGTWNVEELFLQPNASASAR